jgi:hypothetical protein
MSSGAQPPEGQSRDSGRQGRATVNATVKPERDIPESAEPGDTPPA